MNELYTLGTWCAESPVWTYALRGQEKETEWGKVIDLIFQYYRVTNDISKMEVLVRLELSNTRNKDQSDFLEGFFDTINKHADKWENWEGWNTWNTKQST
jgi:hypothetical protein